MDFTGKTVSPQINLVPEQPGGAGNKIFPIIVQFSIVVFLVVLIWFSFVFYPRVVDQFKGVGLPQSGNVLNAATVGDFPIETAEFRIVYEQGSNTYYTFVQGNNLADFADNKNRATLAIKSALSLESVCKLNIIYSSVAKLSVPRELKIPANCS